MGFGRDVRGNLFHQVTGFSTKEVDQFGAPSLITRITNDVQQVQMLVFMTCTLLVAAPITAVGGIVMAIREDGGLSLLLLVSIPVLLICVGLVISRMVPQFRLMQERIDAVNRVLREQITGVRVVRAFVREPEESARFAGTNQELTETSLRARAADGVDVPDGHHRVEPVERGRHLVRRQPHRRRRPDGRRARRLPQLPGPDPDRGDDGHVHGRAHPPGGRVRGADPGGARHRAVGDRAGIAGHRP